VGLRPRRGGQLRHRLGGRHLRHHARLRLASLGFGFFRPDFTSGASLAVEPGEQNAVAGMATSVNGVAYIAAPAAAVALYELWKPLPFAAVAILMLALVLWGGWRLSDPIPAPSAG
jgi:hypothetical protein